MGGSFKIGRAFGIEVKVHWTFFLLLAFFGFTGYQNTGSLPSALVTVGIIVALFVCVLLHEFGHALACRQVGGRAERIVLWPLGGIAFVSPPPRAGAMLWSIAAGPMVNLLLLPILTYAQHAAGRAGWVNTNVDAYLVLLWLWRINLMLLLFNLLPIYPLDGGQIVRALLWFPLGQVRSLFIATGIGFVGGGVLLLWAFSQQSIWIGIMAFFLLSQAAVGWRQAQYLKMQATAAMPVPPDDPHLAEKKTIL